MSFRKRSPQSLDARATLFVLLLAALLLGGCAGAVTLHSKAVPASAAPAKAFTWPDRAAEVAVAQVHTDDDSFYVALSCPVADHVLEIKEISWAGNGGSGIYLLADLTKPLVPTGKQQSATVARATFRKFRQPPGAPRWVSVVVNNGAYVHMLPEEGVGFTAKDGYACEFRKPGS